VKLHIYFDEPVPMWGVEVETCTKRPPQQPTSVWVNFDDWAVSVPSEGEEPLQYPYPQWSGWDDKTFYARRFTPGTRLAP
jgi:hypothetical protein